jgi:PT repeat/Leucine rich repeat
MFNISSFFSLITAQLQAEGQALCDIASGISYLTSNLINWDSGASCASATNYESGEPVWCSWPLISCTNYFVNTVVMGIFSGSGTISSSVWNLKHLENLRIFDCQITGTIPSISGTLSSLRLRTIQISETSIIGTIPSAIGIAFPGLLGVDLSHNGLVGPIPPSLGSLRDLMQIDFSYNSLTSSIPPLLGSLMSLTYLDLSNNQLTGTVPAEISALSLSYFSVDNNHLSGSSRLGQPTSQPSLQPTSQPSSQPSLQPSSQPTFQPSSDSQHVLPWVYNIPRPWVS